MPATGHPTLPQQIEAAEAHLGTLYRARAAGLFPPRAAHARCEFPPAYNFTHWPHADVRMPAKYCAPEHRHPTARSLADLARDGHVAPVTVLPSLIVPCCAHSGTTFLWRCMQYAFHPEKVCGRVNPRSRHNPLYATRHAEWTSGAACGERRYLLPGLTGNIQGHWDYRKEWFFYGGGAAAWSKGWAEYTGVELPLCYWEKEFQRLLRERPLDDTLANNRRLCLTRGREGGRSGKRSGGGGAPATCTHRACLPLDLDKVRLAPEYAPEYDRKVKPRFQFQASKALPRVAPHEHTGAVVSDMTPNYLCAPKALRNLAGSLGAPRHFRMLLLTRRPIEMITASYKMFVQWGWVRSSNLDADVRAQLNALRSCNATLYAEPALLRTLPAHETLAYFGRCWRGSWRDFVANSMPFTCVSAWIAAGTLSPRPPRDHHATAL